jgi:hypothetical protein
MQMIEYSITLEHQSITPDDDRLTKVLFTNKHIGGDFVSFHLSFTRFITSR